MDCIYLSDLPDNFDTFDEYVSFHCDKIQEPLIVRMEFIGVVELICHKSHKQLLVTTLQSLIDKQLLKGKIIYSQVYHLDPLKEIKRCELIIKELECNAYENKQDCLELVELYTRQLKELKWTVVENEVDCLHIKILTRTVLVTNLIDIAIRDIRSYFSRYGSIEKLDYDRLKKRCFIKFRYRKSVDYLVGSPPKIYGIQTNVLFAWTFGPQDDFDYTRGVTISHIERLTNLDKHLLTNPGYGGFDGPFRGGITVEEPFMEQYKAQKYLSNHLFSRPFSLNKMNYTHYTSHSTVDIITILSRSILVEFEEVPKLELIKRKLKSNPQVQYFRYNTKKNCYFIKYNSRSIACKYLALFQSQYKSRFCKAFGDGIYFNKNKGISHIPINTLKKTEYQLIAKNDVSLPCEDPK